MVTLVIPTVERPYYTQRTRLDGREYILRFAWNEREERWYLDIRDSANDPIVSGIKLIANWPLLRFSRWDDRVPPGELWVIDLSKDQSPPGLRELGIGKRCELTYFTATDV